MEWYQEEGKYVSVYMCVLLKMHAFDCLHRDTHQLTDYANMYIRAMYAQDLRADRTISLQQCQQEVSSLIKDKIVIGHALKNDLSVLMIKHSKTNIRDTSFYVPYMRPHPRKKGEFSICMYT